MTGTLRVVAPGLMTTVQDLGRRGYQRLGVPVSGALDPVCLRAANHLVGNPPGTGALEIALQGPTLMVEADSARIAVAGGSGQIEVRQEGAEAWRREAFLTSILLRRGDTVRIGAVSGSSVAYLAVEGGLAIEPVMGSQSTLTRAGIGGLDGRPLRPGDTLPLARASVEERGEVMLPGLDLPKPGRIRIVLGPQDDYFTEAGIRTLLESTYTVTQATDRMGMRLAGPALQHSALGSDIISDGIATGSIQVPGNGLPIILLVDRQTTGGYPKVATVVSADLPALGRMTPGTQIAFTAVGVEAAEAAARALAAMLAELPGQIVPLRREPLIDVTKLMGENLVSGMVDARDWSRSASDLP